MQATIEIDEKLIPDDYEAVAFRMPIDGEPCLNGCAVAKYDAKYVCEPTLIVRRKWQWPSWLTCKAIAKDSDGAWFGFNSNPAWDGSQWIGVCENGGSPSCCEIKSGFFDLSQLPECSPEDSLRNNPNWKE